MEGQFDDAAQDRVRAAVEFLDPSKPGQTCSNGLQYANSILI